MARPLRLHMPRGLYHVMTRGNAKQRIFLPPQDYQHFLDVLSTAPARFRVECCGYCLMPTHYHALLRPADEPLSRLMQQVNASYAQYFNRTHDRVGHVFQGRFKSLIVEGDEYSLTLLRYTMRNPVAANLTRVASAWPWSSYRATAGLCAVPSLLSLESVWATFDSSSRSRPDRLQA